MSIISYPWFFHNIFLPFQSQLDREPWPEKLPRHWAEFCDDIQYTLPTELCPYTKDPRPDGIYRLQRLWSTGTGKTLGAVRALPLYLIGIDPNTSVLLGTSTKGLGERHVEIHKQHLTQNEPYLLVFGPQHSDDSNSTWRSDKLCVDGKRDQSSGNIEVFGYGAAFEGVRFDVAISDDVVTKDNCKTADSREKVYSWMHGPFHSRLHPRRRLWVNIGTVHNAGDAYCRIEADAVEKGNWDCRTYRMVDTDRADCPWPPELINPDNGWRMDNVRIDPRLEDYLLWPEFWTPEKVVEDYISDRYSFALTRQNRPRDPESKLFKHEVLVNFCRADGNARPDNSLKPRLSAWDWQVGRPAPGSEAYDEWVEQGLEVGKVVLAIDVAATVPRAGSDPDYTVFGLWVLEKRSNARILVDLERFRTDSPNYFSERLARWVNAYGPDQVVFESNAMARWIAVDLQDRLGIPIVKSELKDSKIEEIENFRDLAENNLMLYAYANDGRTRQKMQVFEDELEGYPDEAPHDDTLIMAIHAMRRLKPGALEGVKVHVLGAGTTHEPSATQVQDEDPAAAEWRRDLIAIRRAAGRAMG